MNKRFFIGFTSFILAILAFFLILSIIIPPAKPEFSRTTISTNTHKVLHYVALGDSLTEGVGDSTKEGGFVPLFSEQIEFVDDVEIISQNFGKAGDTSKQINARLMKKDLGQSSAVRRADFITLTVGGNDLMHAMSKNLTNTTVSDFKKPMLSYQKSLKNLFDDIRKFNSYAEIYVFGIYNPFYLQFSNIPQLQEICDNWNAVTQKTVENQKNIKFIPINALLYKGVNGEQGVTEDSGTNKTGDDITNNDALSLIDKFHPNNVGYQIMANAVFKEYQEINNEK